MSPSTILALLDRAALVSPNNGLIFSGDMFNKVVVTVTYPHLYYEAQHNALLLRLAGAVSPGKIIVTYFDNHKDNIIWFWSIVAAGGIPAVLSSLANDLRTRGEQLDNIESIFGAPTIITSQRLTVNFMPTKGFKIATTEDICQVPLYKDEIPSPYTSASSGDLAVILFTSGSTGRAKAVEYTHAQLIASVKIKSVFHKNDSGTNFLSWISFDHSANFCELHLNAIYSASNQVHVPTADLVTQPAHFFHFLSSYQIGYTFLPNSFLAAATKAFLAQEIQSSLDLRRLSVIMTGGEANKTSTISAADELITRFGARPSTIKSAYGLSETCSACFYNTESPTYDVQNEYVFASVGKHLPGGLQLRIITEDGKSNILEAPGAIQLQGDVVFKRYYNNPADTNTCMTSDQWFDTGDMGLIDRNGNLRIIGRSKEIIIINGHNYSSFELEHTIETSGIQGITTSYTATFSLWDRNSDTESIVVLFNPSDNGTDSISLQKSIAAINKAVIGFCAKQPLAIIPLPKEQMPKSTIGKLSRRKLRESYEAGIFDQYQVQVHELTTNEKHSTGMELHPSHGYSNGHANWHARRHACGRSEEDSNGHPDRRSNGHSDGYDSLSPMGKKIAEIYSTWTKIATDALTGPDALLTLGIDSLGYMRIKKTLQDAFRIHQEIPMAMLLSCSSIDELERSLLAIGTVAIEYDPIVPLSTRGSQHPLFLLHPGAGEFLCWMKLLPSLPDRPVYALRAKGLHKEEGTFGSFEQLLSCYYDAVKRTQPHGPYALLGYCFGGLVAFELAKRLEAAGDQTVFVGGIDSPPDLKSILGKNKHRSLMIDIFPEITSQSREDAEAFAIATADLEDEAFYDALFNKFAPGFAETMDLTPSRLRAYGRVEDSIRCMTGTYDPSGSVSKYDSFRASPLPYFNMSKETWHTQALGLWSKFCQSEVRWHDMEGDHYTCVKDPHVDCFQREVKRALAARGI